VEGVAAVVQRLVDIHGQPVPSLTAEILARQLVSGYRALDAPARAHLLRHLATRHRVDPGRAREAAARLAAAPAGTEARLQEEVREALVPPHNHVFRRVGQLEGGVKFLVDLRAHLLAALGQGEADSQALRQMSSSLQALLAHWFSVGFLQLERVSWNSPCSLLEKVAALEAVHPVRDWTDLRARVGPYRRCFVYSHPSMPGEPLVLLHVALTETIASTVSGLVKDHRQVRGAGAEVWRGQEGAQVEEGAKVQAAIFYSVTSTQPGLAGIEMGTHLIKGAVASLAAEFPSLSTFSTLSPVPGFRAWLLVLLTKAARGEEAPLTPGEVEQVCAALGPGCPYTALGQVLRSAAWVARPDLHPLLSALLTRLCARYLYLEKRRSSALNPVANFHIRNGACMWRINWLADPSPRGMEASCGLMVNYRYYLDRLEANSLAYLTTHAIDADSQVTDLLA